MFSRKLKRLFWEKSSLKIASEKFLPVILLFSGRLGAAMGLTDPLELLEEEPAELLICNFSGLAGTGGLPKGFLTLMEGLGVPFLEKNRIGCLVSS